MMVTFIFCGLLGAENKTNKTLLKFQFFCICFFKPINGLPNHRPVYDFGSTTPNPILLTSMQVKTQNNVFSKIILRGPVTLTWELRTGDCKITLEDKRD